MKLIDYIFLHRPMLIIPVWTIALLGKRAALWPGRASNPFLVDGFPQEPFAAGDLRLLLMLLAAGLVSGGAFVLNQIYDIESDRKNQKLFLLADGHVRTSEAWVLYFVSTAAAIALGFWLNWQLGILLSAGALLGVQYSHPRFKVRRDPYKSCRNNVLAHGMLAFLFGWVLVENFNIESVLKSVPYMFGVAALYLNTTLPDVKGDEAAGKITYAVDWGRRRTQAVAIWLAFFSLITAVMAADYACSISAAATLPFLVAARVEGTLRFTILATKVAILALSIFAVLFFPIYLVLLAGTILISRAYYASKFSISYPNLWDSSQG